MTEISIQTFRLTKRFDSDRVGLDGLTVRIEAGTFVYLTGASGAGKSTLLRLLYGATRPTEGQAIVDGRNLARLGRADLPAFRRRLGLVFQDSRLLLDRTAFENVALPLEIAGVDPAEVRRRAREMLERVGLAAEAQTPAIALSSGERQRVAVARALIGGPAIVLADEPTADLDEKAAAAVFDLLGEAHLGGATVVVATHDEARARDAESELVLDKGRPLMARGRVVLE